MKPAIQKFNSWAHKNKDEGMEKNHAFSVSKMLELIPSRIMSTNFSFIDIGCGNGWVVKKIKNHKKCIKSVGVDGAQKMIQKAIKKDSESQYLQLDIENMDYKDIFDIVFSMEVFYYFKDPDKVLEYIYTYILKPGGCMLFGIDHYLENKSSLSWSKDLDLELQTFSMDEWISKFKKVGFSNIKKHQFGVKENWAGTMVIYCEKSNDTKKKLLRAH